MGVRVWVDVARQLLQRSLRDDVAGLASELACRFFLELFPFFVLLASFAGPVADRLGLQNPTQQVLDLLTDTLPGNAADPIRQQLELVLGTRQSGLGAFIVLGGLWLAAGGGAALLKATNRVFELEETRPWWERYLVGLAMSALSGGVIVVAVGFLAAGQLLTRWASSAGDPAWFWMLAGLARWILLFVVLMAEATVVFRVAPNQKQAWRFVTAGTLFFGVGWMAASALFVAYVNLAGGYAATYGALGGVIVLLLWLQITAMALLTGAELNALLHGRQDEQSATERQPRPAAPDARGAPARPRTAAAASAARTGAPALPEVRR
jgi:membrane protein